jgi:hypothetical protein
MIEMKVNVIRFGDEDIECITEFGSGEFQVAPKKGDIIICPDGKARYVEQIIHQFNGPTVALVLENEDE